MFDQAAAEPRRVLMLYSYGFHFAPWHVVSARFREELFKQSPQPVDLYEASLDTARFREAEKEAAFVDNLRALFAERQLDLVVAMGAPAARFFQRHRSQFFPSTPLLIVAAEERTIDRGSLSALDAAVTTTFDLRLFIDHILQVLPKTTTVAVVIGASPLEKFWAEEMRKAFFPFGDRVQFEWLNDLPFNDMQRRVSQLPPQSAVFYATVWVDAKGIPYEHNRALAALRAVATAPIFSIMDHNLGHGIVGGPLQPSQKIGDRAAEVAVRILNGETPDSIKTPPEGLATPAYDWRELQRWNISEASLPVGSIVQFRAPTLWESYRWHLMALFLALLGQAALIGWLFIERHGRRRAELQSQGRLVELMHLNRTAGAAALSASLSHELYQPLAAILSNAEAAELLLKISPMDLDQMEEILADSRQADLRAAEIIRHLRDLVKRKSELELQKVDLNNVVTDTLRILSPEAKERNIVLSMGGVQRPLPVLADQVHLQQVLINLASNGMDAMSDTISGGRVLTIHTAEVEESEVRVSVSDRGIGIPREKLNDVFNAFYTTKQHGTGLGLSIARTIVETYGGRIWAENRSDGGAAFHFTLPLAETGTGRAKLSL